jgi:hypothetical protein
LLIDPFLDPAPAYLGPDNPLHSSSGLTIIELIHFFVNALTTSGWVITDRVPSVLYQTRSGLLLTADPGPGTPTPVPSSQCQLTQSKPIWHFFEGGLDAFGQPILFITYSPYAQTPPVCDASNPSKYVWVPEGTTLAGSAANIAAAATSATDFTVTYEGTSASGYVFKIVGDNAMLPIEYDDQLWSLGAGEFYTSGGYYELKSQEVNGSYLSVRIGTVIHGVSNVVRIDVLPSGGGSIGQRMFQGTYAMVANELQFCLWQPQDGVLPYGGTPSGLLASLLAPTTGHMASALPGVLVVGSNTEFASTNYSQLVRQMHWSESILTGIGGAGNATSFHSMPGSALAKTPTLIFRALRGAPVVNLAGRPLIEPAYAMLAANPNDAASFDLIAGRLWDMVLLPDASDPTTLGGDPLPKMLYGGHTWVRLTLALDLGDLTGSLWVACNPFA